MGFYRDGGNMPPIYRKPRRRIRRSRAILLGMLLLLIVIVVFSARTINALNSFYEDSNWANQLTDSRLEDELPFYLFFGVNSRSGRVFADHMALFTFDPEDKAVSVLYLPGETLADPSGEDTALLGEVYSSGGTESLVEAVCQLTGLPIHYYLQLDYKAVSALVDLTGGISKVDAAAWLGEISPPREGDIFTGPEFYSRLISILDSDGVEEERLALAGLLNRFKQVPFWKLPSVSRNLSGYIRTNLSRRQADELYSQLTELNYYEHVTMVNIPGTWRQLGDGEYLAVDTGRLGTIVSAMASGDLSSREIETVEVLNGVGASGLAAQAAAKLEENNFKVINVDNADHFDYEVSQVIRHGGSLEVAKDVALLIPGSNLVDDLDDSAEASITVILGKNYPRE